MYKRQAVDSVLGRVNRENYNNWFDEEFERITALKNDHIKECYRRITQEMQWRNTAKQEERKKDCIQGKKGNMETRTNETGTSKMNE